MAMLTVWRFDTPGGADRAAQLLERPTREERKAIADGAVVEWRPGDRKPRTRQLAATASSHPLGTGFWDLVFGLIFFLPLVGAASGAATGVVAGALDGIGMDDHFINRIRDRVTPGTSALFLLTAPNVTDRARDVFGDDPLPEMIATALDADQEAALHAVFGD